MRIECVATSRVPSTTANSIQVMKVCEALAAHGHQVKLCVPAFNEPTAWDSLAELYGLRTSFEIAWLPFRKELKQYDFCLQAASDAKEWKAEVFYTWALQAAVFAQRRLLPVIMEFHDLPSGKFGPFLFKRYISKMTNTLTLCNTDALRQKLELDYQFQFESEKIRIAPNGTDPEIYADLPSPLEARKHLGLPQSMTVGYSGHFYPGRGVDLLFELAKLLPHIHFLLVGGNEKDIEPWREYLKSHDILNLTLTGFVSKIKLPSYLAAADILVMPYGKEIHISTGISTTEVISPMKMFDYLASGRPIISSEIPVLHEVLHSKNTIFCPSDDIQSWAAAIDMLSSDSSLRSNMGKNGKLEAQKYAWIKRQAGVILQLENLINTGNP